MRAALGCARASMQVRGSSLMRQAACIQSKATGIAMAFGNAINAFVVDFTKDIDAGDAAIFAGAGMSKSAGYVDWPELLRDIASELDLSVDKEHDLISLAQFHVNHRKGSGGLSKKIMQEFSAQAKPTETHEILARMPIATYWTTNYDTLIEDALRNALKIPDVKMSEDQLSITRPKRDAIIYKMHGDIAHPNDAIIYKEQYERYYQTHELFVTALSGDLISKTFLFIGFSFTDPNLDYVLSRLHASDLRRRTNQAKKQHYAIMRQEKVQLSDDEEITRYKRRKQELRIDDLKRFGIQTLLVDEYSDIPRVLAQIENRYRKRTVFISGSAEQYGDWTRSDAQSFVHALAAGLIRENLRVVNGFGWGIGSAVINGALEQIYASPEKHSEAQLIIRPFPQFSSSPGDLQRLWEQYRQRMISLAGIAIFIFGNKLSPDGGIIDAAGVHREFEISVEKGLMPIPVGATGYASKVILDKILIDADRYYRNVKWIVPEIEQLAHSTEQPSELAIRVVNIAKKLNK
jgi:hypothetical protein